MVLSKEEAKRLSIISVAEQLGMELKRTGSYSYNWVEHDSFVIDAKKMNFTGTQELNLEMSFS